jgi:hypothetical protein
MKKALSPFLWLTGNRLVDTALLTNLAEVGDPPSFGNQVGDTEAMWFSAPARMPCGLSVGALSLRGRLHLSFRYRRPLLGEDAADLFADRYVDGLLDIAHA